MSVELNGARAAFLVSSSGVEQVELTRPWQAVVDAGGEPVLIAPQTGQVQAFDHDVEKGDPFTADLAVGDAEAEDLAGVVVPGGTTNADHLRSSEPAVALVEDFVCPVDGWTLTTSRNPDDLDAFCSNLVEQLAAAAR